MASTYFDPYKCTYATCSVQEYGQLSYIPSLAGNALYLALFCLFLISQIVLGIKYRTWGYLIAMFSGIALEIVGYSARIELHIDDFNNNFFIIYLVGLTIGPAFFSASIYLCLARIIAIYGTHLSWLKPRTITCFFILCDFLSLCLQAAGGALASLASTSSQGQTGVNIMIAGLSTQVASTTAFVCLCAQLAWAVRRNNHKVNPNSRLLRRSRYFRVFLLAIGIATVAILIRCCFRVAELSGGFSGSLANNQVSFMILDGAMMIIAVSALTAAHPGLALGPVWQAGAFRFRTKNQILATWPYQLLSVKVKRGCRRMFILSLWELHSLTTCGSLAGDDCSLDSKRGRKELRFTQTRRHYWQLRHDQRASDRDFKMGSLQKP